MRVAVTGGAGFIGSHLVEGLVAEGHEVVVLDSFATGHPANLEAVRGSVQVHRVDVADAEAVAPLLEGVRWVFHLAALAAVAPSLERPLDYHRTNVTGTVSVLEGARRGGCERFVYAASCSCYGIPEVLPTPETAPIQLRFPYALTKHLAEEAALHWGRVYGMPVVSLRFFNAYGPRARTTGAYGSVLGVFLRQRLEGAPLTIVGDGTQTRDFIHVSDLVAGMLCAARSSVKDRVYNLGSGTEHSVNDLADLVGGPRVHLPRRPGEPDRTRADITRIRKELGWEPRVSFEEGVRGVLERIEDWREAPLWTPEAIARATEGWFRHLGRAGAPEARGGRCGSAGRAPLEGPRPAAVASPREA